MITEVNAKRNTIWVIAIATIARLMVAAFTGLGTGESYYFRGARELELSYFDQPPLFFWLSGITIRIFGENNFALRLPAVLLFAGTCWFLFLIARRLYSAKAGFYAVVFINLSAVFTLSIANWYQPDGPLMFFWMACAYCLVQILFPEEKHSESISRSKKEIWTWWILTGITMGLTTLSKYHVIFLLAGVFVFILTNPSQRHWLRHPGPYVAILINLIFSLPILIWNSQNGWASFVFQGSRAGAETGLHPEWVLRSIGGQALWILPWIWIPLVMQLFILYRNRKNEMNSFFFWTSILPIVFFTIVTLWSDLQFHFHWQAPGYMMLFIPLGKWVAEKLENISSVKWTLRWMYSSLVITTVSFILLAVHTATGMWTWYGPQWLAAKFNQKIDPTIDGVDYHELHEFCREKGWLENDSIFIGSTRWWLAGKVDWALKGEKDIVCFDKDARNLAYLVDPNKLIGKDAIIIGRDHESTIGWYVRPFFKKVKKAGKVYVKRGNEPGMELQIYYATNFRQAKDSREEMPLYRQLSGKRPYGNP